MMQTGSFVSEVFVHGLNYTFQAQFTRFLWNAQVTADTGAHFLSLSCVAPSLELDRDYLEDAIAEWVHQAVVCCADALHLQPVNHPRHSRSGASHPSPTAANSDEFYAPNRFELLLHSVSQKKNMAFSDPSRLRQLHERSIAAIQRFQVASDAYEQMRRQIPLEKIADYKR